MYMRRTILNEYINIGSRYIFFLKGYRVYIYMKLKPKTLLFRIKENEN